MEKVTTLDELFQDPYENEPIEEPADAQIDTPPEEPTEDSSSEVRQAYYEYLQQNQLLDLPEDFDYDGSAEKFEEAISLTKQRQQASLAQQFFESLPTDYQEALKAASQGISLEEFYESAYSTNLDISTEESQRRVLHRYLKETSSLSDQKISKLISTYEEEGTLKEEAQDAAAAILDRQQQIQQQRAQAQQEALARQEQERQQYTQQLVDAIKTTSFIHPSRKEKVKSFFFSPIKSGNEQTTAFNKTIQNILANPTHQAQLADILLDYSPEQGFTLERFEKRVKARATSSFKEELDAALDPKKKAATPASVSKTDTNAFLEEWFKTTSN